MAHTIAIYNFKGGVGKTTSSYHLAFNWANEFRTLLIDCDPQKNLTSALVKNVGERHTIFNYITSFLHNAPYQIEPIKATPNLHIIPGDHRMVDLESNNQFIEFGLGIIQKMLQYVSPKYDLIIMDCPSYFGKTVKYFIGNSAHLLVPATPDSFSLRGVTELLRQLKEIDKVRRLNVLGIFFTRYRSNFKHHQKIREIATRIFGHLYLDRPIRNTVRVSESLDTNGYYNREEEMHNLIHDYQKLSNKVVERLLKNTASPEETNNRSGNMSVAS